MAKLPNGIFGPISGKIGSLVGSTWMGIPYVREISQPKANPAARSAARLANEEKFKFINNWLVPFHSFLTVGFSNLAIRKTAIAAALSANYKTVFSGTWPDIEIAYEKLQLSAGNLPQLKNPEVSLIVPDTLEFSWQQNSKFLTSFSDQVMLVVYSPELQIADGSIGAVNRAAEQYTFRLSEEFISKKLEIYISVLRLDRKSIADSQYLGRIEP